MLVYPGPINRIQRLIQSHGLTGLYLNRGVTMSFFRLMSVQRCGWDHWRRYSYVCNQVHQSADCTRHLSLFSPFFQFSSEMVLERANRSIQQLSNMLVNQSSDAEVLEQSSSQHSPPESSRQQTQQSEAGTDLHNLHCRPFGPIWTDKGDCADRLCRYVSVSHLRSLLQKQAKEGSSPSPSKRKSVTKVRCMTVGITDRYEILSRPGIRLSPF